MKEIGELRENYPHMKVLAYIFAKINTFTVLSITRTKQDTVFEF